MQSHPVATYHSLLFSLAYRMLGSVQDAEDMVQETFLRWSAAAPEEVRSPKDYLCTTITRLCIDHLRSARVRREMYVGTWLPEPLLTEPEHDPSDFVLRSETLSTAFLLLLESLAPVERAVFLLREVFDYDYTEIARMVDKTPVACRQIARRARQRVAEGRTRFAAPRDQVEALTRRFVDACAAGDIDSMLALLSDDVTLWSDGGGRARTARNTLHGADVVARCILGVDRKFPHLTRLVASINGQPGVIRYAGQRLHGVFTFDVRAGRIQHIYWLVNPDKLRAIPPAPPGSAACANEPS